MRRFRHRSRKAAVKAGEPSNEIDDQVIVWFAGDKAVQVYEFRTDADAEWSTAATYDFDLDGAATYLRLVVRPGWPMTEDTYVFDIRDGFFIGRGRQYDLSRANVRAPASLAALPFAGLVARHGEVAKAGKICAGPAG